jgi:hypothetical protein
MFPLRAISIFSCVLLPLLAASSASALQSRIEDRSHKTETPSKKSPKVPKRTVWNLDGGAFFITDGHLENGSCFRLSGQVTAPDFFDGLRRVDTDEGTAYFLRDQIVTEFPGEIFVTLHLLDAPCSLDLKETAVRPPITAEIISTLRLNFYWKAGVTMRPVESSKRTAAGIRRLTPYSTQAAEELAPRFEWNYSFIIQSAGVPLSNDLVFIIENEDHKIAARTAARL